MGHAPGGDGSSQNGHGLSLSNQIFEAHISTVSQTFCSVLGPRALRGFAWEVRAAPWTRW